MIRDYLCHGSGACRVMIASKEWLRGIHQHSMGVLHPVGKKHSMINPLI